MLKQTMTKIKRKSLAEGSKPDVKEEKYEHATLKSEEVKRIIRGVKDINKNQIDTAKKFKERDIERSKKVAERIERSKKITEEYLPEWKKDAPEPTSRLRQGKPKLARKGWK